MSESDFDAVLGRLAALVDGAGLTADPLPLVALRDQLDAAGDGSDASVLLAVALDEFHAAAVLRQLGDDARALPRLDSGRALLASACSVERERIR